jgi:hypothetical protein
VHCFNGCVGRETEAGPAGHSVGLGGGAGSTFSRGQFIRPTLLRQREMLSRIGTAHRKRACGVRGPVHEAYVSCVLGFPLQGIHQFESP